MTLIVKMKAPNEIVFHLHIDELQLMMQAKHPTRTFTSRNFHSEYLFCSYQ